MMKEKEEDWNLGLQPFKNLVRLTNGTVHLRFLVELVF